MATPRKKHTDASPPSPLYTQGPPVGYEDMVIGLIPALQELVAWWQNRKTTLEQVSDTNRHTDLDDLTYTQIVNEAFRQYFEGL